MLILSLFPGIGLLDRAFELEGFCVVRGRDFTEDMPFRKDAKLKAVANGVPLPMGRAIARAVKRAMYPQEGGIAV